MGKIATTVKKYNAKTRSFARRNQEEIAFVKKYSKRAGSFIKRRSGIVKQNLTREYNIKPGGLKVVKTKDIFS